MACPSPRARFHALAYEIIGDVEGEKPALAPTATDDKAFLSLIRDILRYIVNRVGDVAETVIGWLQASLTTSHHLGTTSPPMNGISRSKP